ncbi:hypothetical protein [Chitinophaga sp. SYP-B3965]|uniref:hypothetical protein n=1 Tax=Chitinophaga sp. SYP-B3965 TaxID=2663120 RepID=UPI001C12C4D2|nr:hypothetical protein [Chitinophaga sp. SYP-B3965]
MIKVDFTDTYKFIKVNKEMGFMTFISPLKNGQEILLKVNFSPLDDPMLPDVYNLSFGPLNDDRRIDDT